MRLLACVHVCVHVCVFVWCVCVGVRVRARARAHAFIIRCIFVKYRFVYLVTQALQHLQSIGMSFPHLHIANVLMYDGNCW